MCHLLCATSNSVLHLTVMKRNFVVQRFHLQFSCSSSGYIHMCLFQLMYLLSESELSLRPGLNVCVGLAHTFLKTTQVSCLTANSLCCPPSSSTCLHGDEVISSTSVENMDMTETYKPAKFSPTKRDG